MLTKTASFSFTNEKSDSTAAVEGWGGKATGGGGTSFAGFAVQDIVTIAIQYYYSIDINMNITSVFCSLVSRVECIFIGCTFGEEWIGQHIPHKK